MNPSKPLLCLALCAALTLATACDRRDAYPPDESRTTTDQVTPPGVQGGHVTAPGTPGADDDRCTGLSGEALQECTTGSDGVPMILGEDEAKGEELEPRDTGEDAPARDNRTGDRNDGL